MDEAIDDLVPSPHRLSSSASAARSPGRIEDRRDLRPRAIVCSIRLGTGPIPDVKLIAQSQAVTASSPITGFWAVTRGFVSCCRTTQTTTSPDVERTRSPGRCKPSERIKAAAAAVFLLSECANLNASGYGLKRSIGQPRGRVRYGEFIRSADPAVERSLSPADGAEVGNGDAACC